MLIPVLTHSNILTPDTQQINSQSHSPTHTSIRILSLPHPFYLPLFPIPLSFLAFPPPHASVPPTPPSSLLPLLPPSLSFHPFSSHLSQLATPSFSSHRPHTSFFLPAPPLSLKTVKVINQSKTFSFRISSRCSRDCLVNNNP